MSASESVKAEKNGYGSSGSKSPPYELLWMAAPSTAGNSHMSKSTRMLRDSSPGVSGSSGPPKSTATKRASGATPSKISLPEPGVAPPTALPLTCVPWPFSSTSVTRAQYERILRWPRSVVACTAPENAPSTCSKSTPAVTVSPCEK